MKFTISRSSIEAIEKRSEVTIIDALNVFYDLCEDIKNESGESVFKLPVGDEDAMVNRLNWAARTIVRVAEKNPEILDKTGKTERFNSMKEDLERIAREAQDLEKDAGEASVQRNLYTEKKNALLSKQQEIKALLEERDTLKAECGELEQMIASVQTGTNEQLQQQKTELEGLLKVQNEETDRLNEEIARLTVESETVAAQLENADQELDQLKENVSVCEASLSEKKQQLEQINQNYLTGKQEEDRLTREMTQQEAALKNAVTIKDGLVKALAERKADVENYQKECEELSGLVGNEFASVQKLQADISQMRQSLEQQKSEYNAQLEEKDRIKKELEENIFGIREQIETVKNDILKLQEEYTSTQQEREKCQEDYNRMNARMKEAATPDQTARINLLKSRISMMKRAKDSLLGSSETLKLLLDTDEVEQWAAFVSTFRNTLDELDAKLKDYANHYRKILEFIESSND